MRILAVLHVRHKSCCLQYQSEFCKHSFLSMDVLCWHGTIRSCFFCIYTLHVMRVAGVSSWFVAACYEVLGVVIVIVLCALYRAKMTFYQVPSWITINDYFTSWYQTFAWIRAERFFFSKFGVVFRQVLSWTEHCVPWPEAREHLDQCRWWPGRCKSSWWCELLGARPLVLGTGAH